jgi:hypothetical protein
MSLTTIRLGYNSFISNDKFPLVNGSSNLFRLAQDARITTLGSYDTRKGFDFHSDSVGVTQDQQLPVLPEPLTSHSVKPLGWPRSLQPVLAVD